VIVLEICRQPAKCSTIEEVHKAFQEIAYSYYMREKSIQYNHDKQDFFTPEEATLQNVNFLVCSAFVNSVYKELLNITVPKFTSSLLSHSEKYQFRPEVVAYSPPRNSDDEKREFLIYNYEEDFGDTIYYPTLDYMLSRLEVGDILTYTGHAILVYDIIKDSKGKTTEAIIIESTHGIGEAYVNSKINEGVTINKKSFGGGSHFLYLNSKINSEGLEQGSIGMTNFTEYKIWTNINNTKKEYSILRFIHKGKNGQAILKYRANDPKDLNNMKYNGTINLSNKNLDRIKFSHLYIEKTVDKFNGNIVEIGETLLYKIRVKNRGKENYKDDLIIVENLSEYVKYQRYYTEKALKKSENKSADKKLIWNIGKLKKGEEVIIEYSVLVKSGVKGDIILSTGTVGNIPSSTIKNMIGNNLGVYKQNAIKIAFDNLKGQYCGKKLINQIYKEALNVDLKLEEFDITKLIKNTKFESQEYNTIYLDESHSFYGTVLNNYWSSMAKNKYSSYVNGKEIDIYDLKYFREHTNSSRRQDFIYPETFKTGDILIYINNNDSIYEKINKEYVEKKITFENGEYAYIYIEGKGFVGINYGNDGKPNTKEDRNEFTAKYYSDNDLELFAKASISNEETLEIGNLQTLFGKDYYVILRPSLNIKNIFKERRLLGREGKNSNQGGYIQPKILKEGLLLFSLLLFLF
jgi:hypothetical protein